MTSECYTVARGRGDDWKPHGARHFTRSANLTFFDALLSDRRVFEASLWKQSLYTSPDEIFAWSFCGNGQKLLAKRSDIGSHTRDRRGRH
jgi:hypothetical protein